MQTTPASLMTLDAFDPKANAMTLAEDAETIGHTSTPAKYKLQSVIMHKGSTLHYGHYVAFIRKEIPGVGEDWVFFNDEQVVRGGDWDEVYKTGYVYFFRRI
jgi:ubiquitin carboxyl-terminal hydrolase 5/13